MKKKKLNKKILKIVAIIIIVLFSSIAGVYAERIIASSNVTYNNSTSGLNSTNVQGAVDELYLKCVNGENGTTFNFARYLQSMNGNNTVVEDDGTADHNMRYTGKTPNNYVTFEGEEWRVIGVFNNVDNGTGIKESRVKIIKSTSIGRKQWHSSNINVWKSALLNTTLQATAYASSNKIENALWYLGDAEYGNGFIAMEAYIKERGTTVADGNDPTWPGKVALMYLSDYGFASSECKDGSQQLSNYNNSTCINSNWLYSGLLEWFLTPYYGGSTTYNIRAVGNDGHVGTHIASYTGDVRPTVYLKSNVICKNCNEVTAGTKENPFQLG